VQFTHLLLTKFTNFPVDDGATHFNSPMGEKEIAARRSRREHGDSWIITIYAIVQGTEDIVSNYLDINHHMGTPNLKACIHWCDKPAAFFAPRFRMVISHRKIRMQGFPATCRFGSIFNFRSPSS
jgi:hypothetical protein